MHIVLVETIIELTTGGTHKIFSALLEVGRSNEGKHTHDGSDQTISQSYKDKDAMKQATMRFTL